MTLAGFRRQRGNSRSWLYTQPDISSQIPRLRQKTDGTGSAGAIPHAQRATDASPRARLTAAHDRNKQLGRRERQALKKPSAAASARPIKIAKARG